MRLRAAGCVFAEDEARLLIAEARSDAQLDSWVKQRAAGLPLEQTVGFADFCGIRIAVDPGVFVPRLRTGLLVEQAVAAARTASAPAVVVDLCCGTGAVGAVVARSVPGVQLHAVDVDEAAVACARRNVSTVGGRVHHGDLYHALPERLRGHVDVLTANAPYVPTSEIPRMPREARLHEARVALDGGSDGLDVARRVVAGAGEWLSPHGVLLVEVCEQQAADLAAALKRHGLSPGVVHADEWDATVVAGRHTSRR